MSFAVRRTLEANPHVRFVRKAEEHRLEAARRQLSWQLEMLHRCVQCWRLLRPDGPSEKHEDGSRQVMSHGVYDARRS
jgi:hypothetical protein